MSTYEIPIPPSTNGLYVSFTNPKTKRPVRKPSVRHNAFIREADTMLAIQRPKPVAAPVEIVVTIYGGKGFSIQGDISNRIKAAEDAIVRAGIIPDDNVQTVHRVTAQYVPPTNPKLPARATVEVRAAGVTEEEGVH